jgi:hypothetical protein
MNFKQFEKCVNVNISVVDLEKVISALPVMVPQNVGLAYRREVPLTTQAHTASGWRHGGRFVHTDRAVVAYTTEKYLLPNKDDSRRVGGIERCILQEVTDQWGGSYVWRIPVPEHLGTMSPWAYTAIQSWLARGKWAIVCSEDGVQGWSLYTASAPPPASPAKSLMHAISHAYGDDRMIRDLFLEAHIITTFDGVVRQCPKWSGRTLWARGIELSTPLAGLKVA